MSDFECHVREGLGERTRESWREACEGLSLYGEHGNQQYCVLHFPGEKNEDAFWEAVKEHKIRPENYDFRGTVFPEGLVDFEGRKFVTEANFAEAVFAGKVNFRGATFVEESSFQSADFRHGNIDFRRAEFCKDAKFGGAKFHSDPAANDNTDFSNVTFGGYADFMNAEFRGNDTFFFRSKFSREVTFWEAKFNSRITRFSSAEFGELSDFRNTEFHGTHTDFSNIKVINEPATAYAFIQFSGAKFCSSLDTFFSEADFGVSNTDFRKTEFSGRETVFNGAKFGAESSTFDEAKFRAESTSFSGAEFHSELTSFSGAEFSDNLRTTRTTINFWKATFCGERTTFEKASFAGEFTNFMETEFRGKSVDFKEATFSDGNEFKRGETSFENARFVSGKSVFSNAKFLNTYGIKFPDVTFSGHSNFHDASLWNATFENTTFQRGADFTKATFDGARAVSNGVRERTTDFRRAIFGGELYFRGAEFQGFTDFYRTNFLDAVKFIGGEREKGPSLLFAPEGQVSFKRARIDKPELFSFDTLLLRPSWFVGVDARKFDFTAVQWYGLSDGSAATFNKVFENEINGIREKGETGSPYILLAQACSRLSANAEENREYPLANEFHYWSLDALRKETWHYRKERWHYRKETWDGLLWIRKNWLLVAKRCGLASTLCLVWDRVRSRHRGRPRSIGLITTLYWALSGYGVRAGRALGVLLTIAVAFAVLYMTVGHSSLRVRPIEGIWQDLADAGRAVMYSLGVMARLRPEPIPEKMGLFQILVTIEGILGPLQIALLALAIRRKVMR